MASTATSNDFSSLSRTFFFNAGCCELAGGAGGATRPRRASAPV